MSLSYVSTLPRPQGLDLVQDIWNNVRPSDDQIPLLTLVIMLIVESMVLIYFYLVLVLGYQVLDYNTDN